MHLCTHTFIYQLSVCQANMCQALTVNQKLGYVMRSLWLAEHTVPALMSLLFSGVERR